MSRNFFLHSGHSQRLKGSGIKPSGLAFSGVSSRSVGIFPVRGLSPRIIILRFFSASLFARVIVYFSGQDRTREEALLWRAIILSRSGSIPVLDQNFPVLLRSYAVRYNLSLFFSGSFGTGRPARWKCKSGAGVFLAFSSQTITPAKSIISS